LGDWTKMKQISEKHLVLIAAFFAFLLGAYSIYSVINLYAQTTVTNDDGTTVTIPDDTSTSASSDSDSTTIAPPPPSPEPEPDPTTTTSVDDKTVDDNSATTATSSDATKDDNSTDQTDSTTTTSDDQKDSSDSTDSSDKTVDTTSTTTSQPPATNSTATTIVPKPKISVNTEEYIKKFVPRTEVEAVFAKDPQMLNEQEREKVKTIKREAVLDSDADGLPDYEEYRLGTDIFSDDTDQDGFKDGEELKSGFDPKKFSAGDKSDKISYQDPEAVSKISPVYKVTKAQIRTRSENQENQDLVELSGTALPNSIVTIYVFSDPLVMTVEADNDGNWFYVLHQEFDEGEHKVYAAVTDSTGKVTERSEAMLFVKTAQALDQQRTESSELQTQMVSPVEEAKSNMTKVGLAIAIVSVILAIVSVAYFLAHRSKGPKTPTGEEEGQNKMSSQTPTEE